MSRSKPPRKKHRPLLAGMNPVAKAVSGAQPLTTNDNGYTRLAQIAAHHAAVAFAEGAGTAREVGQLASAFNVAALLVTAHMDGGQHATVLTAWRSALLAVAERTNGRASIGELGAITAGLQLHDALLAAVTLSEMSTVLGRLKAFALAGMLMEIPT